MADEIWVQKTQKIRNTLDEATERMSQNLEDSIGRGESLDVLLTKSQNLETTSFSFKKKTIVLKESFTPLTPEPKDPGCSGCLDPLINSISSLFAEVTKSAENTERKKLTEKEDVQTRSEMYVFARV